MEQIPKVIMVLPWIGEEKLRDTTLAPVEKKLLEAVGLVNCEGVSVHHIH